VNDNKQMNHLTSNLKIQVFWNVSHTVLSYGLNNHSSFIFRVKFLSLASQCSLLFSSQKGVTSHDTWTFLNTTVKTSYLKSVNLLLGDAQNAVEFI